MTELSCGDTLFISDLDGTLLHPDAKLSQYSREQLCKLLLKGLPFTIATARTIYSVQSILEGLPLQYPLILQNGAVLYDPVKQEYCHAAIIAKNAADALFACLEEHPLNGFVYCMEDRRLHCCYTHLSTPAMRTFYQERKDRYDKPFRQVNRLRDLAGDDVTFCSVRGAERLLRPAADAIQTIPHIAVSFYRDVYETDCWYLEIAADTATKYHGALRLREMLGIRQLVAFGDNDNDLPLFAASNTKIAVANATPALYTQADNVIGRNTEDAVVNYLLQYANVKQSQSKGV